MATADSMARAAAAKKAAARNKRIATARKTSTTRTSADRLSGAKRTGVTAGKPSGTMAQRAKQNAGVKDGTVRLGAKGKAYNMYDAKTATWKRIKSAGGVKKAAPKKPFTQYGGVKKPSAGMVGPATVGVKNPKDGSLYRFGPPNNIETYRWNGKTKKFVKTK